MYHSYLVIFLVVKHSWAIEFDRNFPKIINGTFLVKLIYVMFKAQLESLNVIQAYIMSQH